MDKDTLKRLIPFLPEDATEISIKGHDTKEVFFNTDEDYSKVALPAQRGTYQGQKKRWRMSENTLFSSKAGPQHQHQRTEAPPPVPLHVSVQEDTVIQLDSIPKAD